MTGLVGNAASPAASLALFSLDTAQADVGTFPMLFLQGQPGASYRLEYATNLVNWTFLAPVTLNGGESYYFDAPLTGKARRFYRAVPQ